jgi:hypothetical protein
VTGIGIIAITSPDNILSPAIRKIPGSGSGVDGNQHEQKQPHFENGPMKESSAFGLNHDWLPDQAFRKQISVGLRNHNLK